jgi:hypothetical protein
MIKNNYLCLSLFSQCLYYFPLVIEVIIKG